MTNSAVSSGGLGVCDNVVAVKQAEVPLSTFVDSSTAIDNLFDGDTSTYFSVHRESTQITFELDEETEINGIGIGFFMKAADEMRIQDFSVALRKSGDTDYTTVISRKQSSGEMGDVQTFPFNSRTALFIRFETHGNSFNNWSALTEIEVCAVPAVEANALFGVVGAVGDELKVLAEEICSAPTKLAVEYGKVSGSDNAMELFDRNFNTRWSTINTQNESDLSNDMVQISFQGDMRVSTLQIAFFDGYLAHQYFSVYVQSSDAHTWTPVLVDKQAAMEEGMQVFDMNLDGVQTIYIVGGGNDFGSYTKLAEVEVYGC